MTVATGSDPHIQIIEDALIGVGYPRGALVQHYDYAYRNGQAGSAHADLVAFADSERHDIQTSCIAVKFVGSGDARTELEKLSYLAVPLALLGGADSAELWTIASPRAGRLHNLIGNLAYEQVKPYFTSNRIGLRAEAIMAAKSGKMQLSFFDLDRGLLAFAYDATQDVLVSQFERAVTAGMQTVQTPTLTKSLTRLALQLLAAAILEDKRALDGERSEVAEELLAKARRRTPSYFRADAVQKIGPMLANIMLQYRREGVTFRSFTNEMLGHFYENTFLTQPQRQEFGIYYTPPSIARRILERLPIENIQPSSRSVLDWNLRLG